MWRARSCICLPIILFELLSLHNIRVDAAYQDSRNEIYREDHGAPIPSYTATRTCGPHGPIVLEDTTLIQHIAHFDRERIAERVVHAKGGAAFGFFEVTNDISQYSKAVVFKLGVKTPMVARFSTVTGESGSADSARDPRGFALRFYTSDGNWDMVGNNTPIFFVRDPMLFIAFIHSQKRNPRTHRKDPNMAWDFITQRHETLNQILITYSDGGTPKGFRYMNGFGSHTYVFRNAQNIPTYVKMHWLSNQGIRNFTAEEATRIAGENPDYSIQDLYEAIENKEYPSWNMYIQVMSFETASQVSFNVLDVTKIWPEDEFPLIPVGRFTLNRNPQNYYAQVEQLAFCPSNMIPGIEPSRDKMLQARLFSYKDTQRHRLGPNFIQIPVNSPLKQPQNLQRDGQMLIYHQGSEANYFPNSVNNLHPDITSEILNYTIANANTMRYDTGNDDNYSQARTRYEEMSQRDKDALAKNIGNDMKKVRKPIKERVLQAFSLISSQLTKAIAYYADAK